MKVIFYLILLACVLSVTVLADCDAYSRVAPRSKKPVTDTVVFISTKPDTVAVYRNNGITCYTDGSLLISILQYRVTELKEMVNSQDPNEQKCVENYQKNLDLCLKEMKEHHDTINMNRLTFEAKPSCYINEDLIRDQLENYLYKVSNLKTGKDELMLIAYKVHKNSRKWYDQIRTSGKINIYKGIGTLDKF